MIRHLLLNSLLFSAPAFAQLTPSTPAPLIEHLREVNAEWRTHTPDALDGTPVAFRNEAERIAAHLHLVQKDLLAHAPEGLSAGQAAHRADLLRALDSYADAGRFPQNHVLPYRNPIFIDPHNTACAVGQLMIESGHRDLAERIDAEMELAYIREIKLKEVDEWAVDQGFTKDELAWIQPGYPPSVAWFPLGNGTNGEVSTLLRLANGDLLVAGQFTQAGEETRYHVARWDGSTYQAMGTLPDGVVTCASEFNGTIRLGGSFDNGSVDMLTWNGTAWMSSTTFPSKASEINTFHVHNGVLHASGSRSGFAGTDHIVARLVGGNWEQLGQVLNAPILALESLNGDLYCGGLFTGEFLSQENDIMHVARLNNDTWEQVADGLDDNVYDMLMYDDKLYATGNMVAEVGTSFGLARIATTDATWEQLMPNITFYISTSPVDAPSIGRAMVERNGTIYITGEIYAFSGLTYGSGVVAFHGEPDQVEPYCDFQGAGHAITLLDGNQLVVGGVSQQYSNIIRTDLTSGIGDLQRSVSLSFLPNPTKDIVRVALPEGFSTQTNIRVTDAAGRTIEVDVQRTDAALLLNASTLAAGNYFVTFTEDQRSATGQFAKH